jgi:hypothetical protein
MAADVRIDIAAQFVGKPAFKKADSAVVSLGKSVKSLAKSFGLVYSAQKVLFYGINSVKAFADDDKAAKVLTRSLNNLGLAFADPAVKTFISDLESQYHVLDDKLRPAYQKLVTTTGDWKKSQDLLKTALDLSAMSGNDLESVASDLSRAYAGNTKGLQKYGLGLTKAELTAMSFEQILAKITEISKGQATEAANTYAGALDALKVSAANASETIGKGLVQAFTEASGANGIGSMQNGIADLAQGISDAIIGTERLVKLFLLTADFDFKGAIAFYKETKKADMLARQQYGGAAANKYITEAQAAADKLAKKRALELLAIKNKQLAAERAALKAKQLQAAIDKANLALNKGTEIFDMDKIQIAAALTSQAEQLGKATTGSQLLQIANDTARLKVKQDILNLEDAIASKDQAAIEAATKKLNADMAILGSLQGQSIKLLDIKSILESLKPKDLINLDNLNEALRLLGLINLANTGSKSGSSAATPAPSVAGMTPATTIAGTNANVASLGGVISSIGSNLIETTLPSIVQTIIQPNGREWSSGFSPTININTGIGDPNAIAEAVNQVIQDAVDRGTLRGGAY